MDEFEHIENIKKELTVIAIDMIKGIVDAEIEKNKLPESWRNELSIGIIAKLSYSAIMTNTALKEKESTQHDN